MAILFPPDLKSYTIALLRTVTCLKRQRSLYFDPKLTYSRHTLGGQFGWSHDLQPGILNMVPIVR